MKKIISCLLAAGMLLSATSGCGNDTKKEDTASYQSEFQGTYLISPKEAADKIGDKDVQFLDARGKKKAMLGTVEGASVTDWQSLSTCAQGNAGDENWGLVPDAEDFAARLSELGLDKNKQIIVLGQPEDGWGEDGRVVWELLEAGFSNVKMVDGGVTALKKAGAKLKMGTDSPEATQVEIQELDKSHDMDTETLQKNYDSYKVVDVRTDEEYDGAVLYDEAKGGHLPGAIHIPYTSFFNENGLLKSNEELTKIFESKGLSKTDEIVTYCTGGIRSAYAQLVLEMCGFTNTYNYAQSYWRWAVVGEVE